MTYTPDHPEYMKKCLICRQEFIRATPESALEALRLHIENHVKDELGVIDKRGVLEGTDENMRDAAAEYRFSNLLTGEDIRFLRDMRIGI